VLGIIFAYRRCYQLEQQYSKGVPTVLKDEAGLENHILLVESDEAFGQILQQFLGESFVLHLVTTVESGIDELQGSPFGAVLLNLDLSNEGTHCQDTRALLQVASEQPIAVPVVVYSWHHRREAVIGAFQQGAADFLEQPLDIGVLRFALQAACRRTLAARQLAASQKFATQSRIEGLLGHSSAMERVDELIRKVAEVATTVLITGESGTGKGMVAQAIHRLSARASRPFVAFSPCALPESLIEDELFGHERGAFTGASQIRRGRFEEAKGGTVFLDEIGDLALPLQAKLLRVLQERTIERIGSNIPQPVDVRVICATSRNLEKMVQEGTFREDLYFRISVVKIHMPPLRERADDIPLLAEFFLKMFAKHHSKPARSFTPGFLRALVSHKWSGNVRELQNVIERSVVLANGSQQLGVNDLPAELRGMAFADQVGAGSFHEAVRNLKRELVRSALRTHKGNKLRAAQELRISRCYLHRLLTQLQIREADIPECAAQTDSRPRTVVPTAADGGRLRVNSL
jgi:two-component system, NtrC family, response regulator HydG